MHNEETVWVRFLRTRDICHSDCYGNMPCDYGALCDRCLDEHVQQDFKNWLKNKNEREC